MRSRHRCAWCDCDLPDDGRELAPIKGVPDEELVSHGCCVPCHDKLMADLELEVGAKPEPSHGSP